MRREILNKHFKNSNSFFTIINYKEPWKENNITPFIELRTNGWRNTNHSCIDINLILGYLTISYTNYDYQKSFIIKIAKLLNKIKR